VLPRERAVLCIGAANLDRKLRTTEALQMGTSNPATAAETFGGVARNIAENLARLGTPCALLTALGDDSAGQALRAHARDCGIDMTGTPVLPGAATGTYTAVLDAGGEMAVALADMGLYEQLTPAFIASRQAQRNAAALVIADLNLPHDTVALLLDEARRDGIPLAIVAVSQPKMARLPRDLAGLRLLILNRGELEARAGRLLPTEAAVRDACRAVQAEGARDVIVTCGAAGVYHTYDDTADAKAADDLQWLPAHEVDVVDVTGAGDAFSAAVCWTLAQGEADLTEACARGLRAAALTVQSAHTVSPALTASLFSAAHIDP
jgi:pseudouridine kinase